MEREDDEFNFENAESDATLKEQSGNSGLEGPKKDIREEATGMGKAIFGEN